jgi:hypothetical protein
MTAEDTTTASRPERSTSLNWLLFGIALVAFVIFLIVVAMDRENVVWEDGKPWCPHCRLEVPDYSTKCPICGEKYDWTGDERLCWLCLAESDIELIHAIPTADLAKIVGEAIPGDEAQAQAVMKWFAEIGAGECVHCAGTGVDLFAPPAENGAKIPCPVCFGDTDCLLCDGREKIRFGNPGAHQDLIRYEERFAYDEGRLSRPDREKRREAAEKAVGALQGYDEVEWVEGPDGRSLVNRAEETRRRLLDLLPKKPAR